MIEINQLNKSKQIKQKEKEYETSGNKSQN